MTRLAWRNLWRNPRRSALTILSIGGGLAAVMFGQSLMKTIQRQLLAKSTGVMTGHVQLQAKGVTDHKVPDLTFLRPAKVEESLRADPRVVGATSRLLFTGLAYSAAGSRGVMVAGIEPEFESAVSIIPGYLTQGRYFGGGARDVVLGEKLARELDIRLGEKVVVMAQDSGGEMQSELFRAAGIFRSGSEMFDAQIVYVPLAAAQRLRGVGDRISHVVARLKDSDLADQLQAELAGAVFGADALTYKQVGLDVIGIIKFEDAVMAVVITVIFAIVGLGTLNTVSMSMFERIREFGVLRAIGCRRARIVRMLLAEALLLGLLGAGLGLALGGALIGYWGATGLDLPVGKALSYWLPFEAVIYLRPMWRLHLWSALGLVVVSVGAAIGPSARASRLAVADALRDL